MTNQASEDRLSEIFRNLSVLRPSPKSQTELVEYNKTTDEARTAIQDLIRTEKLKLLAEVRERVVGEDEHFDESDPLYKLTGEPFEWAERNSFRTDLRISLTKLEAEL